VVKCWWVKIGTAWAAMAFALAWSGSSNRKVTSLVPGSRKRR